MIEPELWSGKMLAEDVVQMNTRRLILAAADLGLRMWLRVIGWLMAVRLFASPGCVLARLFFR